MSGAAQQREAKTLLDSLRNNLTARKLNAKQQNEALERLKALGRNADNVSALYTESGIETLGSYAFHRELNNTSPEALRCLANALLLLPQTRQYSIKLHLDEKAAQALQDADVDEEFLLSRILFLLTYDPGIDLEKLVAHHSLADSITKLLFRHAEAMRKGSGQGELDQGSTIALSETLKLLFNATSARVDDVSRFSPTVRDLFSMLDRLQILSPPLQPPLSLVINALANLELTDTGFNDETELRPIVEKLTSILDQAVKRYSSTELETSGVPLLTILRKINEIADSSLRNEMKSKFLPDDKERDRPLGKSSSLPSRLLRLTVSSGLVNLTEAISGLQFELSDKDANQYVRNVGYGYAAGYLMSHKIPIPEGATSSAENGESSGSIPTNPITGQRLDKETPVDLPEMTEEEKEQEAERLFVLFERLKATGVVDVKNPAELARDERRIEELSDSDPD